MVTNSEQTVIDEYKKKGYCSVHCGAPDFIFYKVKGSENGLEDIDINSIEFAEVKYGGDTLSHEQQIWRHILKKLGLRYKLIHIRKEQDSLGQTRKIQSKPSQALPTQPKPSPAKAHQFFNHSKIHIRKEQNKVKQDKPRQDNSSQCEPSQTKAYQLNPRQIHSIF